MHNDLWGRQPRAIKQESGPLTTAAISRQSCDVSAGWGQGGGLFPQRLCLTANLISVLYGDRARLLPTYDPMGVAGLSATGFLLLSRVQKKDYDSSRFLSTRTTFSTIPRHTRSLLTDCI